MVLTIQNFINGAFQASGSTMNVINPSTGKVYAQLSKSQENDVELAVQAADAAFKTWKLTSAQERSLMLNKIADLIDSRLEEFALAESRDQGKPLSLARSVDIPRAVHNFRFFASSILHQLEHSQIVPGFLNYVRREPVGPVALISPWNLPLYLLTWKIAPCLAYGCTSICKPSEFTSMTAYMLCQVFIDAGLPKGVVNMVFGTAISFTGGTVTGRTIYQSAASRNKKLSLELGGKNANIIFDDCDLEKTIKTTLRSSFLNQGEICLCGSRIFVQSKIYDAFLEKFVQETQKLIVGDPLDEKTQVGALVSEDHMNKVLKYIQIAKEEGGTVLTGGTRLGGDLKDGYFVAPTIIVGLPATECRVQKEEIFGPVVTVTKFETFDEAVEYCNSTEYGLAASVWTSNLNTAHKIAGLLDVGTVWINCWMVRNLNMPFGGFKGSGLGREGTFDSAEFFCEVFCLIFGKNSLHCSRQLGTCYCFDLNQ
ncbi:aldehyde dehydrogenase domain-containing protein [Gorgonomyces haynaldii]|nr:aldehyde dehydrogenase domain-containing protein [Gorgonomyces haynaldii]